jgi:uncharacterized membrane protein
MATIYYFSHFLIIIPISGIIDNVLGFITTIMAEEDDQFITVESNHFPFNIRRFWLE